MLTYSARLVMAFCRKLELACVRLLFYDGWQFLRLTGCKKVS